MNTTTCASAAIGAATLTPIPHNEDSSGSIAEVAARLEALCAKQGHLTTTVIDNFRKEARHVCSRCFNTEIRTLHIVK